MNDNVPSEPNQVDESNQEQEFVKIKAALGEIRDLAKKVAGKLDPPADALSQQNSAPKPSSQP